MLIAITGGIGSGKSVVSQLLRVMGYPVYDCDARAKWVMTHDPLLREQLIELFGPETYLTQPPMGEYEKFESSTLQTSQTFQTLNKPYLSSQIFGHPKALARMNACVHPAVARDLKHQYQNHSNPSTDTYPFSPSRGRCPKDREGLLFFFESAILFESGFDALSHPDLIWTVSAPLELRMARASARDHASQTQIQARIDAQIPQEEKEKRSDAVIYNDPEHSLIEQVSLLLSPIII